MTPFTAVPMENTIYKLGASGWGCILMHRDVVTATRPLLKGEAEIIEDDMDVYPYDLRVVMDALNNFSDDNARETIEVLRKEIRPLRGLRDSVGSDIRFPFFARLAGFELHGDTGVMCEHMLNYPISPMDYVNQSAGNVRDLALKTFDGVRRERERIRKATE